MNEEEILELIDRALQDGEAKRMLDKISRIENNLVGQVLKENKRFSVNVVKNIVKEKLNAED